MGSNRQSGGSSADAEHFKGFWRGEGQVSGGMFAAPQPGDPGDGA